MTRKADRAHNVAHLRPEPPKRARAELEFDEPTVLGALFGQFDANLVQLENRLGVYIAARGNRIQIEGAADESQGRAMCSKVCTSGCFPGSILIAARLNR